MGKLFISHSSVDDDFVRRLRETLANYGQEGWIDSRELRGGAPLKEEIEKAIAEASAYLVVVSPGAFESEWVGDELAYALTVQTRLGRDQFPVIPLLVNGTKLGVFKRLFGYEPLHITAGGGGSGVEAVIHPILVALKKRNSVDVPFISQPNAEPLEELVLELTDLKFREEDGKRRATARARLVYEPATPGRREVASVQSWRLTAALGPIEAGELNWYFEQYAIWPCDVPVVLDRARKLEENLKKWGRELYEAAIPATHAANVLQAWANIASEADRRFSIHVDPLLETGASQEDVKTAAEAAAELLKQPWELLHDGDAYLFQGAKPIRVRRRLPNTKNLDLSVVATPIRILLIIARPEDDTCEYIDHRASALPLVEMAESLPEQVKIHILNPPTLPALREELDRARKTDPYHVVHFDGPGVYCAHHGLGGLCFELADDIGKLDKRRHSTVFTDELRSLLNDHRVPLVFLKACSTAQSEKASEPVASELLRVGVASVVAMSHGVLAETARIFVETFYKSLAAGARVGDAMLAGQRRLKDDTGRGRIFGAGELRLEDWFVPVLFQEKEDPQLFRVTPTKQTVEDFQKGLTVRLGNLPPEPESRFVGRSRELLALQRLLHEERYAVIRGQGGEGKTALAAEFARWMVRSQQIRRSAFVSVESNGNERAVMAALGSQLLGKASFATGDLNEAFLEIERALRERDTLIVVDNMESILLPPFMAQERPEALSAEARQALEAILSLCERLAGIGGTRLIFTSREEMSPPFNSARHCRELYQLDRAEALKMVERVLNAEGGDAGAPGKAAREEIEQLVDTVNCHARTLALLAPELRTHGVEATRVSLVSLMAEMEKKFPGNRERSVFASVELSLRRLSQTNRQGVRVFGAFYGGVNIDVLRAMTEWEEAETESLKIELIKTGLATQNRHNYLTLNPALCPYLRGLLDARECEIFTTRWVKVMRAYVDSLVQRQTQNAETVTNLTILELPNLFVLLDLVQNAGDAEATIDLATSLYMLLRNTGKPRLLERVGQVRDAAAAALGNVWNHAQFEAARTRVQQQLTSGQWQEALNGAQLLLQRASETDRQAYRGGDYDLAMASWLLGRVLLTVGRAEQALPILDEARQRFEDVVKESSKKSAAEMVAKCFSEQGSSLLRLGRLDEAATAYLECISRGKWLGDKRGVAVAKVQLGTVRAKQGHFPEALSAYTEARERFELLNEPGAAAAIWHQFGWVYEEMNQSEAAEDAYRKALAISVQLNDVAGQASTLGQLGNLYDHVLNRTEEAVIFYRQAADKYVAIGDTASEGNTRNNLAATLRKLHRLDEARQEIRRAIECKAPFGHASAPWTSWHILSDIEGDSGHPTAADEAKQKAIGSYLAYRRDGGENQYADGRIAFAVTQSLRAGNVSEAAALVEQLAADPKAAPFLPFLRALQAILAGSRDRVLADAPELRYRMAAEILLLIELLESQQV